ncbi:MAG: flagellar hook-basal body protein [Bdellovibrionales bacterium]|nr:flagellar hook-basal body protein [Bdellovibrionales bacterium]
MSKALWPAVSGAIARDHQVEVIANNLANVNTNGFKKDDVAFKEYLSKNEKLDDEGKDILRSPIKDKDLYRLEGRDQSFVVVNGTHPVHRTGGFKVTDNPLDVALEGPGFFEIATSQGIRYTRAGSFKLSSEGRLVTSEGNPVLSASTAGEDAIRSPASEAAGRYISVDGREGQLHINDKGEIYMGEDKIADLSIVEFTDLKPLRKSGGLNFENKDSKNVPVSAQNTAVKQGMIETSNVNPVEEISNLIRANRLFEQDLKAMKTVDNMMGKEVNEIGKF